MKNRVPKLLAGGVLAAAIVAVGILARLWLAETYPPLESSGATDKPNIIVVLIDTLRADHLALYGYEERVAPFLAKLGSAGTVFDHAFSTSSWTAPSTASVFTSLYPHRHGIIHGMVFHQALMDKMKRTGEQVVPINSFSDSLTTLPSVLHSAGYATVGIATNINIGDEIGYSRGFDRFVNERNMPVEDVYDRIVQWKNDILNAAPYFLYLHLNDAHEPYARRDPYYTRADGENENNRALYLSEIGYIDEYLPKIFDALGLDDNDIVVLVSDHGEEFLDHGDIFHNKTLYAELNHSVFLVRGPGISVQRRAENVSLIDVMPTVVEFAGASMPEERDGVSLVPLLTNGPGAEALSRELNDRILIAHRSGDTRGQQSSEREVWAAAHENWKLIRKADGTLELYDHATDPTEHNDVAKANPTIVEELSLSLEPYRDRANWGDAGVSNVEMNEQTIETLKSLGYVE
ncbi:MAG: sulfatase [Candidatus Hydrogenedentota bacterium]